MTEGASRYPIRAVAKLTGLSLDTLRAWERRYQAVVPVRDDRGRMYSDADITRLQRLAALVREGHSIGTIASLTDAALSRLQVGAEAPATPSTTVNLEPIREAIGRYDVPAIEAVLNRHAIVLPPATLIFSVLLPILRDLGERWESGAIRPAQEHLVSAAIRSVLGGLLRSLPNAPQAKTLVLATAAGERHELGLLCAAVLAAARGLNVIYLGPDLPAPDISHATSLAAADTLLIAATQAEVDDKQLRVLSRVPPHVEIWVGGAMADGLCAAIGSRARKINSLEEFQRLCALHVS